MRQRNSWKILIVLKVFAPESVVVAIFVDLCVDLASFGIDHDVKLLPIVKRW